jgi:hypothetical protein
MDFEFNSTNEEKVNLVCCATYDDRTHERNKWWLLNDEEEKERLSKYVKIKGNLLYAWAVVAEARSLYSLGMDPTHFPWIDGFLEYKCLSNHSDELNYGKQLVNGVIKSTRKPLPKWERKSEADSSGGFKPTHSLAEATYKLTGQVRDTEHKTLMRDIILSCDDDLILENKDAIMDYCMEDVEYLPTLHREMVLLYKKRLGRDYDSKDLLGEMCKRGRYAALTGIRESRGYPIDYDKAKNFSDQVPSIIDDCQRDINRQFPDIVPFKYIRRENRFGWNQKATRRWLMANGFSLENWILTDSGIKRQREAKAAKKKFDETDYLSLSLDAWKKHFDYTHSYPEGNFGAQMVRYLKLKQSLNGFDSNPTKKRKSLWDSVGKDKRVRPYMGIYNSQSSRSQPPSTSYLLLKPAWQRALLVPAPGKCITSIDYGSEEFFISALYSDDKKMIEAYLSGDVYLAFAKEAGMAPKNATKASHKAERDACKAAVLGISYLMSKYGLAHKLTNDTGREYTVDEAQEYIDSFKEAYPDFASFQEDYMYDYGIDEYAKLDDGWYIWGDNENHRSVTNFPIQGLGAVIMREADWLAHKAGLHVPCTLHDALYIEHDYGDWEAIDKLTECMREGFAKFFPTNYETARKIKLDPYTWGPDLPKNSEIITPGGLKVGCSDVYIDERAVSEYDKFSKFFNQGEEVLL